MLKVIVFDREKRTLPPVLDAVQRPRLPKSN